MEAMKPKAKKKSNRKKSAKQSTSAVSQEMEPVDTLKTGPASSSLPEALSESDDATQEKDESEQSSVQGEVKAPPSQDKLISKSEQSEQAEVCDKSEQSEEVEESSALQIEENKNDGPTEKNDEKIDEEQCANFAPTAPPPSFTTTAIMLYPDLSKLTLSETIQDETVPRVSKPTTQHQRSCISVNRTRTLYRQCIKQLEDTSLQSDREYLNALEQKFVTLENPHAVAKDAGGYDSELYLYLQTYRSAYHNNCDITNNETSVIRQIGSLRKRCWNFQQIVFGASGVCRDKRMVNASVESRVAVLNPERCKEAKSTMSYLLEECTTKGKEAWIHLHHSCAMVEKNVLEPPKPDQDWKDMWRSKLRIIGNALRTELHDGDCDLGERCVYMQDLRKWFRHLGTLLLQAGTVDDRVWMMFHILRFPYGIGTWAHVLVHSIPQSRALVPKQQLPEDELQDVLTVIHVLLRPISERQKFLRPVKDTEGQHREAGTSAAKADDTFEWVDSDGEDSTTDYRLRPIREVELLSLLEQIPFNRLFDTITSRAMMRVCNGDVEQLPTTEMLRLITFANKVVAVFSVGFSTYVGVARYNHFVQRLALLINDTVKFVSDVLRLYRDTHGSDQASEEVELVQVHFDTFVYGAARCIYGGGVSLSGHLSTMPFALLSSRASWWVFRCLLNRNFSLSLEFETVGEQPSDSTLIEQFVNDLQNVAARDLYNVLKVFVEQALARDALRDLELIAAITKTLFKGLASAKTFDVICAEIIMEQIHMILEQNPIVLSALLQTLAANDKQQSQTIADMWQQKRDRLLEVFIAKQEILLRWNPTESDIAVMREMLLNYPRNHIYHKLALGLLTYINYGDNNELCVRLIFQVDVAYSIVGAFRKNHPAGKVELDNPELLNLEEYQERCLFVLLQLRLHAFDQPVPFLRLLLFNPANVNLGHIPDLEVLGQLKAAVDERCPVACLIALLNTNVGHWVPVFCQRGVNLLKVLLEEHHLDTIVVRCLELISILFIECPQALAGNEQFIALLTQLVENDNELDWSRQTTHDQQSRFALKLLAETKMGKMGSMLVSQMGLFWQCGYPTRPSLICMWCEWFTQIPDWTNNAKVLRLLNVLASISFGHDEAWNALRDKMRPFFQSQAKQKLPVRQSFWSKIIGTEPPQLYGTLPSDCVALALLVYGVEHQQLELDTELWPKLLRTLKQNKALKLDAALRQVNASLRTRDEDVCTAPDSLVFFKVGQFLVRADVEHPLYLAVCQQFFTIYLTRVTDVGDEVHGVTDRLYGYDTALMEKMKQKLCKLELHYHNMQDTNDDADGMLRLVKAFQLWLVDMDLNRFAIDDPINLPEQYDKHHLQLALTGVQECWPECLNQQSTLTIHRIMTERWHNLFRHIPKPSPANVKPPIAKQVLSPVQAIQRRLESCYEDRPQIPVTCYDEEMLELISALQEPPMLRVARITSSLQIVKLYTNKTYWSLKYELEKRQHELYELYRQLYVNEEKQIYKQAKCSILYCTGAGSVKIYSKNATLSNSVEDLIPERLCMLHKTMEMIINIPEYTIHHTIVMRELWNSLFKDYCKETDPVKLSLLNDAIRTMLRTLLEEVTDANFVPPLTFAVQLSIDSYRSDLSHLILEEVSKLFTRALEDGRKPSNVIIAMLENSRLPVRPLLQVYSQLVKQKRGSVERSLFVNLFGNKLKLADWLAEHDVAPNEVDQFAQLIVVGLYKSRPAESVSAEETKDVRFSNMLISHLVLLAGNNFPENYGKMVQHTLNAYTQWPTLPPAMLLALINLLRSRAHLANLHLGMDESALQLAHQHFALSNCTEPVLSMEVLEFLMVTVTEHFARQRDSAYPFSGMYRRHGAYVEVVSMLLGMFSYNFLALGMHDNRIEHVRDHLLPVVYRMFEPWVVPYGPAASTLPGGLSPISTNAASSAASANESTRHFNNDKAKRMFTVLLHTLEYTLNRVWEAYAYTDDCSQILLHFLNWYLEWFADPRIMISALYVFNTLVLDLRWEHLQPSEMLIERMNSLLEHHSPECHEFLACVFVRCKWTGSNSVPVPAWLQRTHASTLAICVRLAYEPVIRSEAKLRTAMVRLLQYFAGLSWETLHVAELTPALDWLVMTAEADSMLRTPKAPCRGLDDALFEFLEVVAGMRFNEANRLVSGGMQLLKRKLYISVVVRMLMNAGRATAKGANVKPQLIDAVQKLLRSIEALLEGLPLAPDTGTDCPRSIEARTMTVELLKSIKKWQTENSLSLFVDELILMLDSDTNAPLWTQYVLESASMLDSPAVPWLRLLESAVGHYLYPKPKEHETFAASTWLQALNIIGYTAIERWQHELLVQNSLPLCLQLHFLHHWEKARCDPVAQLNLVNQLIATLSELKISEPVEFHLYPLWCTLTYSLLTVQPEPDAAIRSTIGLFGTLAESIPFWVVSMVKKILGKETQSTVRISTTRCLISYAFAALLAHVYARRAPSQTTDEDKPDDYSEAGNKGREVFSLSKLLSAPEKRASRERILNAALEHFKSLCNVVTNKEYYSRVVAILETVDEEDEPTRICQHAKDITILLESRAEPLLNSLLEAIVARPP